MLFLATHYEVDEAIIPHFPGEETGKGGSDSELK
jgi:hypothetical protein